MNIHEIQFFEGMDSNVIKEIESACLSSAFEAGEAIFEKGDPADFLYILERGKIDLLIRDKEVTVCSLTREGEVFGWSSIVEKGIYTSTCLCRTATIVRQVPKEKIEHIFNQHPDAALIFYRRLGSIFSKRISTVLE